MKFLEFIFRDFWTFWGVVILLSILITPLAAFAASVATALTKKVEIHVIEKDEEKNDNFTYYDYIKEKK